MAYPKHIWRKGEIINAEPLNNMENGIANEEIRAIGAEEILDNKIEANKASSTDAIDTESIRATAAEDELSQRINITNASIEELKNYVDTKTASTYKASGSVYFAELPELSSTLVGNVYNIKDSFTTTEDFYEGAGETYPAGTNVSIIQVEETTYIPDEVESGEST